MVFITEMKSVYCAVRTGSLSETDTVSSLKFNLNSPSTRTEKGPGPGTFLQC